MKEKPPKHNIVYSDSNRRRQRSRTKEMSTFQPLTNKDKKLWLLNSTVDEISPVHLMSVEIVQLLVHQLDDFQELVLESPDNLSKTNFYQLLPDIIRKKLTIKHAENKANVEGQLMSIKQLKSLASTMKNCRRRVLFTADELTAINLHLNYLEYILELKKYFDDRIFASILKITSQWQTTINKSKMADGNLKCFEYEFTKVNGCSQTTQENTKKSKIDYNKPKCLGEEFTKLSSCSLTEDVVKELSDSVDQIKGIKSRWYALISCSELALSFFEEEIKEDIMAGNKGSQFKLICYVIPDQLKKIEKCVQLSRKWLEVALLKCYSQNTSPAPDSPANFSKQNITSSESVVTGQHLPVRLITKTGQFLSSPRRTRVSPHVKPVLCRISPRRDVNKSHTYVGVDRQRKIIETWKKILLADESILVDEKRARRLRTELKRLANKESRYAMLENNYETTAGKLEQVCTDYRNAIQERHSLNRKIWEEPGFSEEVKTMSKLYKVGDRIEASQKDMKMLKYSFALLQEDMALEASMRSSYIRFEENVKEMLLKLETKIEGKKQRKRRLDKEMILLKANIKWLESKYEELQEPTNEEVEELKESTNNEEYAFEQIDISVQGETSLDKPQLRAAVCRNRNTEDHALSCNSVLLVDSDSSMSSDSDCAGQGNALGGVCNPSNEENTITPAHASFSTIDAGQHRRCDRNGSIVRVVDRMFDELPSISIDIETESDVMSGNQKLTETEENGRVSQIPILRNSSDFARTSRSTMHTPLELKLPTSKNPNHKAEGSINQQKTRIPRLIH